MKKRQVKQASSKERAASSRRKYQSASSILQGKPAIEHITRFLHPEGVILNAGRIERAHGEYYFYEESFTPGVVRVIEALDQERLEIGRKAGVTFRTAAEMFFDSDYGPRGDLFQAVNGSVSLTQVKGPGSLNDRYLTKDLPYSLTACACIGHALGVRTTVMDAFIELGGAIIGMDCLKNESQTQTAYNYVVDCGVVIIQCIAEEICQEKFIFGG